MSKFSRKTTLALAVAAAFALATPAMAATVGTSATTSSYSNVVASTDYTPTSSVTLSPIFVNIAGTDQIIGRSTGFSVRLTLGSGATFQAALPVPTVGPAAGAAWTAAIGAGGTVGTNYVVITLTPGAGASNITNGNLLQIAGAAISGTTTPVTATVDFFDPVTTNNILNSIPFTALTTANPLAYSTSASVTFPGEMIDVGGTAGPSKTGFSEDGTVNGPRTNIFDAGDIEMGVTAGVKDSTGANFTWAAGDTAVLTVTGSFGAFAATGGSVWLQAGGACVNPGLVQGTINAAATSITFASQPVNTLNTQQLCFFAPTGANLTAISATPVHTSVVATRLATSKTASGSADGQAMAYNGPVQTVYTFNPSSNSNQQSILRISNTGAAGGLVTITGTDDAGNASGTVSFNLAAGTSIQLNSGDLENGNTAKGLTGSLGTGTGKWILTITGQIPSMEVTNLNRNNGSGTLNNLGTPVTGDH